METTDIASPMMGALLQMVEMSRDGLVLLDGEHRCLYASPAACMLLGISGEDALGHDFLEYFLEHERGGIAEQLASDERGGWSSIHASGGEEHAIEYEMRRHATEGKTLSILALHDLTSQRREQMEREELHEREAQFEANQESEERYRSIFEATTDGLGILDAAGKFVEVNPAYCKLTGYSHDELIGMHASATIHPDYQYLVAEGMRAISEGRSVWNSSLLVRKDGRLRRIEGGGTQFTYKGGPHFLGIARDISERWEAEEQLREKEEQYRSVFEASTDGLVIHNAEGEIVEINPAYCKMLGYTREELIGKHVSILIPPEYHPLIGEGMHSIEAGYTPVARVTVLRKDGTPIPVEGHGAAFLLNGKPHYLGITRDITERVEAERKLRESEEQYRSIFEATTDGLGVLDMEGNIVEVNPAYCRMYGYSRDEVIGLHALALMPPDYHHLLTVGMQSILMGNAVRVRSAGLRKDGTSFPVDGHGTTFLFNGKPHILGVNRDITEQVEAEEELREREAEYGAVFEATTDGLVINDLDTGVIVEVNPAFCRMHGYTHDEMVGMHPSQHIRPDFHHLFAEYVRTGSRGGTFHTRAVDIRKNGTEFHVDVSGRAFTFRGKPSVLGIVRDITDRVQAEEQLREKEEQYRSIFESSADGLGIYDQQGFLVEANPAFCRMLGYTHDELLGMHANATVHPEYRHVVAEGLERVNRDVPFRTEIVLLRKNGTSFPAEAGATTFTYKGTPHELVVLRDVSERVEAERQIREREAEYRGIFEATNDGLMISDLDGYIVEANPAYARMFGYTREEVIGLHSTDLAAAESQHAIAESVQTLSAADTYHTVATAQRKDGSTFFAEARATRFNYRGEPHYLSVVQDVTERVRSYELLEERVEERTRELSTLLDVSHNVSSTLELQPLMEVILDQLEEVVEYEGASVSLIEGDESRIVAFRGAGSATVALDVRFPIQQSALFQMWQGTVPLIINDVRLDDSPEAIAFRQDDAVMMDDSFNYVRSWMVVPMVVNERLAGILTLNSAEPGLYTPHHAELVLGIASQAAIAIENARLYERSEKRTQELSTLLNVSKNVSSTLQLQPLLGVILDQLVEVVQYTGATMTLIDGDEFEVVANRGTPIANGTRFPLANMDYLGESVQKGPVIVDDVRGDSPIAIAYRRRLATSPEALNAALAHVRAWMVVPILIGERLVGYLHLDHTVPNAFTAIHADLALAIAQQAAIAIENARLYEQAQKAAVLQERQRLSRELHDSVSQALYGIVLGAQTARTMAERDPAGVIAPLDYVVSLAKTGMAEMRALILELRPETLEQEGLAAVLQRQADAISARHPARVTAVLCDEPPVPLVAKEALYRIAQEALHNTVKHSEATEIQVSLERAGEDIVLAIQDNGKGFDTGGSFPGHLGLHSMRERAERFGGILEIVSTVGEGTRLSVRVPVQRG